MVLDASRRLPGVGLMLSTIVLGYLSLIPSPQAFDVTTLEAEKSQGLTQRDLFGLDEIPDPVAQAQPVKPAPRNASGYVTLTIGGDLGFGGGGQPVSPVAGVRHGRRIDFASLTKNLRPLFKSDLVFANLESVVTASNALSPVDKTFNFRMHPNGVAHLIEAGLNVISTANNHAVDYGSVGIRHTIRNLAKLQPKGLRAVHGVAPSVDGVFQPARFSLRGNTFAFAAAGIGGPRATATSPGQAGFRSRQDFEGLSLALSTAEADFKILSLHYGQELQVRPSTAHKKKLADKVSADGGIDLIVGHHAHTPAGVLRIDNGLVFYGLGNLLHLGMQDMSKYGVCRDFGIVARLHLGSDSQKGGRLTVQAIELYALREMHVGSKVRSGGNGRRRIEAVNFLSGELTGDIGKGVLFAPREDGSGLYCAPGASDTTGPIGKLCRDWQAPPPLSRATRSKLRHACRYVRKQSNVAGARPKLRGSKWRKQKAKSGLPAFARRAFSTSN